MTPILHYMSQRSPEWFAARTGLLTASVAKLITAQGRTKGSESKGRRDLIVDLALERVNGVPVESAFKGNADTERGIALESEALAAYEGRSGQLVSVVGFVSVAELPIGCSPDGAVFDGARIVGGVDVKCPRPANHLAYLKEPASLVADYEAQMAHTMLVTGAKWWDLCSYCPHFPAAAQVLIVRLLPKKASAQSVPDPALHTVDLAAHELNVRQFLREVDAEEQAIRRLTGQEAA